MNLLIGMIKQSQAEHIQRIKNSRRDIKVGCILQSRGGKGEEVISYDTLPNVLE